MRGDKGQSIVEVTFATVVISMVLVALLSAVIQSLRNARVALEQTRATQYAEEAVEWLRASRDREGWGEFRENFASQGEQLTYCLPEILSGSADLVAQGQGSCTDTDVIAETNFVRSVQIEIIGEDQIRTTAQVDRPGSAGTISTTVESMLGDWE